MFAVQFYTDFVVQFYIDFYRDKWGNTKGELHVKTSAAAISFEHGWEVSKDEHFINPSPTSILLF